MRYAITAVFMLIPAVLSTLIDCKFSQSRKNIFSKYILYVLLNNVVMTAVASLTWYAKFTPFEVFGSWFLTAVFGTIHLASAVCMPVIIRCRLPKVIQELTDSVLSHQAVFCVVSVLTALLGFLPQIIVGFRGEIFTNFAVFGRFLLSLAVAVAAVCAVKLVNTAIRKELKAFGPKLKKRLADKQFSEFKRRFGLATLVNAAFAFSVIVFVPFETYLGNTGEFVFEFSSIGWIVLTEALIYMILLTVVELFLPPKASDVAVSIFFGITLASYVQGMFMNGSMELLRGGNESYDLTSVIINAAIWFAVAVIPVVLTLFKLKWKNTVLSFGCVLIAGMQAVALVSMLTTVEQPQINNYLTERGLYEVADDDNVIVFVLDCFDQDNVDDILEADPKSLDGLKGFTCYDNVTGSYCYTHVAVPYLLSGERIPEYNPSDEQFAKALEKSPYFNALVDNDLNVGIYTEEARVKGEYARSRIDNASSGENSLLDVSSVMVASQKASMYRVLPLFLKKYFNYTADDFNWAVESTSDGIDYYYCSPYNDVAMYKDIKKHGLIINKDYKNGCYRFIHTSGAHEPWRLDRDCEYSATSQNAIESSLGSIKLVSEYLKRLNELGVYENSTIIITSDHGTCKSYHVEDESELSINPIMFYKPHGVGYDEPLKRSDAPVSHDDIFPTVMHALGLEYENETGMDMNDVTEETERTRYYYWCRYEPGMEESGWSLMHVEYAIEGDSRFDKNWRPTGKIDHCNGWIGKTED